MKKSALETLLGQKRFGVAPVTSTDLSGKIVVVIGANTGIGFQATKKFAGMNPEKIIMACRSSAKGEAALAQLKAETVYDRAEVWLLDLADFSTVVAFADKFEKSGLRLDILVANAAVALYKYATAKDGWEETLQVNNLSTSLLCILLAPRLVETGRKYGTRPRIVVVASSVHYLHQFPEKVYKAESSWRLLSDKAFCTSKEMQVRYYASKLLSVFFARSFAEVLKGTPVIIDSVCPGYCYSELRRNYSGIRAFVDWIIERNFAQTSEEGSRHLIWAAIGSADDPDKFNGAFIWPNDVHEPSDHVLGEAGKKRGDKLWKWAKIRLAYLQERKEKAPGAPLAG